MLLEEVVAILIDSLGIRENTEKFKKETPLLGNIPEFDSMAVVTVITALEETYGFMVDDDEISAETFETVGTLCKFVQDKIS